MKRNLTEETAPNHHGRYRLALLAAAFALGSGAGAVCACISGGGEQLAGAADELIALCAGQGGQAGGVLRQFVHLSKYTLLALLFGFSAIGAAELLLLSAVRGFMLSFSVAAVVRALGAPGTAYALVIFGAEALLTVPCFMGAAYSSLCASAELASAAGFTGRSTGYRAYPAGYFKNMAAYALYYVLLALAEVHLLPPLFARIAALIKL